MFGANSPSGKGECTPDLPSRLGTPLGICKLLGGLPPVHTCKNSPFDDPHSRFYPSSKGCESNWIEQISPLPPQETLCYRTFLSNLHSHARGRHYRFLSLFQKQLGWSSESAKTVSGYSDDVAKEQSWTLLVQLFQCVSPGAMRITLGCLFNFIQIRLLLRLPISLL